MRKKKLLHFNLKNMELNQLRQQIDKIDIELLKLFAKRFEIVKRVGEWKKQN
jgi:chorismate mutase type II